MNLYKIQIETLVVDDGLESEHYTPDPPTKRTLSLHVSALSADRAVQDTSVALSQLIIDERNGDLVKK